MSAVAKGLAWCFTFVMLEAVQAAFLGSIFQRMDAFLIGSVVFGLSAAGAILWVYVRERGQLERALKNKPTLISMNLAAAGGWMPYFVAVQLIEPAIAFAVFSGTVPLATIVAARLGVAEAVSARNRLEWAGSLVLVSGLLALAIVTLAGYSGFVRGGAMAASAGLALASFSGASIAWMLFYCHRLDRAEVGPVAQFGLRFLLYILLSTGAVALGIDAKGEVPLPDLALAILVGLLLIAFPSYAVQRAVALVPPLTIGAVTALGPFFVFVFQLIENRVDYAWGTLLGLGVYFFGAMLAMLGAARAGRG